MVPTFGVSASIDSVFSPKLRVFNVKIRSVFDHLAKTETSGIDSGIFCYRNFGKKYEVSVERKPE
jgi:hypothetical protein